MLVIRTGILEMHVRIANREYPDQTAALEAVWSGSAPFWLSLFGRQLVFKILEHLPYRKNFFFLYGNHLYLGVKHSISLLSSMKQCNGMVYAWVNEDICMAA